MHPRGLLGKRRSPLLGAPPVDPFDPANFPNFASALTGGTYPRTVNHVAEGDSLTAWDSLGPSRWARLVQYLLGTQVQVNMVALGGRTLANMVANVASRCGTQIVRTPGVMNVASFQGGINDIVAGGVTTAAQIANLYQAEGQALKAQGFDLVVAIGPENSGYFNNATYNNIDYATTCADVAALAATFCDLYIDVGADSILGIGGAALSNTSWRIDNTHPTPNADARKARTIIYPPLQAKLAPADRAAGNAVYGCFPPNGPIGASTAVGVRVTHLPPMAGHTVTVTVGGKACTAVSWDPTLNTVYATVPSGSSTGDVAVVVDGVAARGGVGLWTATNSVIVASIQPSLVLATGGPATIHGNPSGASFVAGMVPQVVDPVLGVVPFTSVVIVSPNVMTCVIPALTPTVAGMTPLDVEVGGSIASAATKLAVLPSNFVVWVEPCPDLYSGGTLQDTTGTYPITQPTGSKQPTATTAYFGGTYALAHNSANSQELARNLTPAAQAVPYGACVIAAVPATIAAGGMFGSNAPQAVFYVTAGGAIWWLTGGSAIEHNVSASSWPGNCFMVNVNGASSKMWIDGVDVGATIVGTPLATGPGLVTGYDGSYSNVVFGGGGLTNAPFTAQQVADMTWISEFRRGTP